MKKRIFAMGGWVLSALLLVVCILSWSGSAPSLYSSPDEMKREYYGYQNYMDYSVTNYYGDVHIYRSDDPKIDAHFIFNNSIYKKMLETAMSYPRLGTDPADETLEQLKSLVVFMEEVSQYSPEEIKENIFNPIFATYSFVYCSYLSGHPEGYGYSHTALIACPDTKEAFFWLQENDGSERWVDISTYYDWAITELNCSWM